MRTAPRCHFGFVQLCLPPLGKRGRAILTDLAPPATMAEEEEEPDSEGTRDDLRRHGSTLLPERVLFRAIVRER